MCCNADTHSIELLNLLENETITHSILLIKGRIIGALSAGCELKQKEVVLQYQEYKQNATLCDNARFKLLIDLQTFAVDNSTIELKLLYCSAKLVLRINYKPIILQHQVQPLLITCQNSKDANRQILREQNLTKIDLNLRVVQSVYAEKLREAGFGRLSFSINDKCCSFNTQLSEDAAWQMDEDALWHYFAQELVQHFGNQAKRLKFICFIECTYYDAAALVASGDYSYANIRSNLKAHAALGGGGLALFGSAFFYAWPQHFDQIINCFCDEQKVDLSQYPDDSNYRCTWAGVYATTLGAVCHELGHTFDLGHTTDGVMGTGFDYLNRVFVNAAVTEHLPSRIIHKGVLKQPQQQVQPRFTQLKKQANDFLQKYHEQKENDGFYFTRNCALILSLHKWFRSVTELDNDCSNTDEAVVWSADKRNIMTSKGALKLIELRCVQNSLVNAYFELENDKSSFKLPLRLLTQLEQGTHSLFVLTASGHKQHLHFPGVTKTAV